MPVDMSFKNFIQIGEIFHQIRGYVEFRGIFEEFEERG